MIFFYRINCRYCWNLILLRIKLSRSSIFFTKYIQEICVLTKSRWKKQPFPSHVRFTFHVFTSSRLHVNLWRAPVICLRCRWVTISVMFFRRRSFSDRLLFLSDCEMKIYGKLGQESRQTLHLFFYSLDVNNSENYPQGNDATAIWKMIKFAKMFLYQNYFPIYMHYICYDQEKRTRNKTRLVSSTASFKWSKTLQSNAYNIVA